MSSASLREAIGLLLDASKVKVSELEKKSDTKELGVYCALPIDTIFPGKFQPRKTFDELALKELSDSIRKNGILQPLVVRKSEKDKYEIIAGERRWRASKIVGLKEVPVIIREVNDESALAFGILENLQREGLNPIEESYAFKRLIEEFSLTHEDISIKVGKSRVYITNSLRLLKLPKEVQEALSKGAIQVGHAKAILSLKEENLSDVFNQIVARNLSVRETESLVRKSNTNTLPINKKNDLQDSELKNLEMAATKKFKLPCKVKIKNARTVSIEIIANSVDELKNKILF